MPKYRKGKPVSHFITLVLIPGDTDKRNIEPLVDSMLEPFSESLEVEPYETECFCIGIIARHEAEEKVEAKYNLEQLREKLHGLPPTEQTDDKWQAMVSPRLKLREKLIAAHPMKDKPNPKCKVCKGGGTRISRCNPIATVDWWRIGGRWDGSIWGPEREKACSDGESGFNFGAEHQTIANNCRRVSEIPIAEPYYVPHAILTPEGEWIEKGSMGWWGIIRDEASDDQWHETVKAVLAKYPEHLAVAVDCHI